MCSGWWIYYHRISKHQPEIHGWCSRLGDCDWSVPTTPACSTCSCTWPNSRLPHVAMVWALWLPRQRLSTTLEFGMHAKDEPTIRWVVEDVFARRERRLTRPFAHLSCLNRSGRLSVRVTRIRLFPRHPSQGVGHRVQHPTWNFNHIISC